MGGLDGFGEVDAEARGDADDHGPIGSDGTAPEQPAAGASFRDRVLDAIGHAVIATDGAGVIRYWNRAAEELYGWSSSEAVDRNIVDTVVPDAREEASEIMARVSRGQSWTGEFPVRRRDGSTFVARVTDSPILNGDGELVGVVGVSMDITERKRAEDERARLLEREREMRRALERARADRERLIRGFSHDLRDPLGIADAHAAMLEEGVLGPLAPRQRESVGRIRAGLGAAVSLVDDLVDLTRARNGRIGVHPQTVDLREPTREVADAFAPRARAAGIELHVRLPPERTVVRTDPARVRQILRNLLSNAVKYTPSGGRVTLDVRCPSADAASDGPRWAAVEVADTGPGVPPDCRESIFEEFTRIDDGPAGGAGLGLAISRQLARLLGGDLTVETGDGAGSTFILRLPDDAG